LQTSHVPCGESDIRTLSQRSFINYVLEIKFGTKTGIAADYRLDERGVGVRVLVRQRIPNYPYCPDRLWGPPTQPPIQWLPGDLPPLGVKQQGREAAVLSPSTSAEAKKTRIYAFLPPPPPNTPS
jgi:hypothetical protein